jgi:hypothetical protein
MRATNLGFRSPKEKTAEFGNPVVTFDGRALPILHRNRHPTFGKSRRFSQYEDIARRTGKNAGPGAYNLGQQPGAEWKINGTPLYRDLHQQKDTGNNAYIFVGSSMLYEPSFILQRKGSVRENSESSKIEGRRASSTVRDSENTRRNSEGRTEMHEKQEETGGFSRKNEEKRVKTAESKRRKTNLTQQFSNSPYLSTRIHSIALKFKEIQRRKLSV